MKIIHYLLENTRKNPDKTAVICGESALTYSEFTENVRRLSCALSELGVRSGTHIGLLLHSSVEFVTAMFAAADLGATLVPMNNTTSTKDLISAIEATNIEHIIVWHAVLKAISSHSKQDNFASHQNCISVGGNVEGFLSLEQITNSAQDSYQLGNLF